MDFGINLIGINKISEIIKIAKIIENNNFNSIWLGEGPNHRHIFSLIASIADKTEKIKIGTSILSVNLHNPIHVIKSFKLLEELYGKRFILGIGRGGNKHLQMIGKSNSKSFPIFERYLNELKNEFKLETPLFLGATGIITLKKFGNKFDGVIINHISPKFVEWTKNTVGLKNKLLVIGPCYYLPNKNELDEVFINCALIASEMPDNISKSLGIKSEIEEIRNLFLKGDIDDLKKFKNFLINNFSLIGTIKDFNERIDILSKIGISEVIFGYPIAKKPKKLIEFMKKFKV